ncbi:MAG TPA: hypothetical protein VHO91_08305 [Rhodopila sp.]|nr:hypothetical protein [Rhodopila sp.]
MATERSTVPSWVAVPAVACLLLWPAVWNGYPIVFADTGTYLSQAIHRYAGWDRPVFYSLFMLPLHATVTLWPVLIAQALLTAWVLWLVWRVLAPNQGLLRFVLLVAALSACTWLPWIVSEIMPDILTPLLVLAMAPLIWAPEALSPRERRLLAALATVCIAAQQSSLALALLLIPASLAVRSLLLSAGPAGAPVRRRLHILPVFLPPALAALMLCLANFAAHGRFAVSPFGNVFLLARVIADGPGMATLQRDCARAHWRLCPYLDRFPATSDDFLWRADSPLYQAGGPKRVSAEAGAIIAATLRSDPAGAARAAIADTWMQAIRFDSGDGLQPWPSQVSHWIRDDFPAAEYARYRAARQQSGQLRVPDWLAVLHRSTAIAGVIGCTGQLGVLLYLARRRAAARRQPNVPMASGVLPPEPRTSATTGVLLTVLLSLPISAAVTGALSGPHDRYQSRIMWLPPFVALAALPSVRRAWRSGTPLPH